MLMLLNYCHWFKLKRVCHRRACLFVNARRLSTIRSIKFLPDISIKGRIMLFESLISSNFGYLRHISFISVHIMEHKTFAKYTTSYLKILVYCACTYIANTNGNSKKRQTSNAHSTVHVTLNYEKFMTYFV